MVFKAAMIKFKAVPRISRVVLSLKIKGLSLISKLQETFDTAAKASNQ